MYFDYDDDLDDMRGGAKLKKVLHPYSFPFIPRSRYGKTVTPQFRLKWK